MDDTSILQDDLRDMLRALGMSDAARPQSPHEVFRECITRAERLRAALKPFAVAARMYGPYSDDVADHVVNPAITLEMLRRAASAFEQKEGSDAKA